MASKKRTKDDYPIVKYRIVDGNGYVLCKNEDELNERLERSIKFAKGLKPESDVKRFMPQYVVKVTEEYMEIPPEKFDE